MPCPCQNQTSSPSQQTQQSSFQTVNNYVFDENCPFTLELIKSWQSTLLNIKNSNTVDLYNLSYQQINSYLGIIQSAINFSNNICFFKTDLQNIQLVINALP